MAIARWSLVVVLMAGCSAVQNGTPPDDSTEMDLSMPPTVDQGVDMPAPLPPLPEINVVDFVDPLIGTGPSNAPNAVGGGPGIG